MTLTREQIETFLANAQRDLAEDKHFAVHPAAMIFLCQKALRALELEPRPISEAPKDGTRILAWWGGEWVVTYWAKRHGFEGWQPPSGTAIKVYDKTAWHPTEFTALPEPRT